MKIHERSLEEDQFRTKWKKRHGRVKGANRAWKRRQIRMEDKWQKQKNN